MDWSTYTREHIMPLHIEMVFADIGLVRYQHVGQLILQNDHIHADPNSVETLNHSVLMLQRRDHGSTYIYTPKYMLSLNEFDWLHISECCISPYILVIVTVRTCLTSCAWCR